VGGIGRVDEPMGNALVHWRGTSMSLFITIRGREVQGGMRWLLLLISMQSRVLWVFFCRVGCPRGPTTCRGLGWIVFWSPYSGNSAIRV
jgi:hypothetical protein